VYDFSSQSRTELIWPSEASLVTREYLSTSRSAGRPLVCDRIDGIPNYTLVELRTKPCRNCPKIRCSDLNCLE
jgi:hypothetical protein